MHAPTVPRSMRTLATLALAGALLAGIAPAVRATTPLEALEQAARLAEGAPVGTAGRPGAAVEPAPGGRASVPVAPATGELVPGSVGRSSIRMVATYAIEARLRVADRELRGTVWITARNESGGDVDRVRLNTTMGPLGALVLGEVTVDGSGARAALRDQTITVELGGRLPPGGTTVIEVPFRARLRSTTGGSSWLFTRANGITSMYRWVPWISRVTAFDRPNFGDPFVTPVSPEVTLRLRTDRPVRVVVNGRRTSISEDGLETAWRLHDVRDVVVNAASDYRSLTAAVGDTEVRVHTRPGQPQAAILDAATSALRKLEDRLGPYPWPVLRIVQSSGGFGMEGPGVVWIPAGVAPGNLRYLVMHETAHQWFYGLVGNDQAREPFADEAITDMVARYLTGTRRGPRCATGTLDGSIYDYSAGCYYERVYIQGGNLLDRTRETITTRTFFATLRRYLDEHRWELVRTRTLLNALDDATGRDLADGWRHRFPTLY